MADDGKLEKFNDKNSNIPKQIVNLDSVGRARYEEKLIVDGERIPDPYQITKNWEVNVSKWPSVMYGDIYQYLIKTPGVYTKESLRAYKSLEGFNFYQSGHVHEVFFNEISNTCSACILKSKVTPSQRVGDKPHEPWVCVDKNEGYIISAHCTCKAGLGEACSHVAALLFKIERAVLYGLNCESKTSVACQWNQFYRKKVLPQPIAEISFSKPKHHRQKNGQCPEPEICSDSSSDDDDKTEILRNLKRICPTACVLTKEDSDTDSASDDEDLPPLLNRFHEVAYRELTREDLIEKCQAFVKDFTATDLQAQNLERMTRGQHNSPIWHRQRQGRITATLAHDIMTLKPQTSRHKLLARIMKYNNVDLSNIKAVEFGRKYEGKAKDMYTLQMREAHNSFHVSECGLIVDTSFPVFAATPDGVRSCSCHGDGLVEIKCSFKHKDSDISEISDATFYLDSKMNLKTTHRYYTQVQFQLYVSGKKFCDFVVYTHKGITIQSIPYDPEFVGQLIDKCTQFAFSDLVPEILQHKLHSS